MIFGSDKLWPTPSECHLLATRIASEEQGPFSAQITSRDLQFRQNNSTNRFIQMELCWILIRGYQFLKAVAPRTLMARLNIALKGRRPNFKLIGFKVFII